MANCTKPRNLQIKSFHGQNQPFRCLLRNEWRCWGEVYGIQIKKVKKHFTLSHNSVNSYCYFAHMEFHDHTTNIFQISQQQKKSISLFFSSFRLFTAKISRFDVFYGMNGGVGGRCMAYKSKKSKNILLSHITLLTHIAISRTWNFTTTQQIFSKYLNNKKSRFRCFFRRFVFSQPKSVVSMSFTE